MCEGADADSDHFLVAAETQLKVARIKRTSMVSRKFNLKKFSCCETRTKFALELRNRFTALAQDGMEESLPDDPAQRIQRK